LETIGRRGSNHDLLPTKGRKAAFTHWGLILWKKKGWKKGWPQTGVSRKPDTMSSDGKTEYGTEPRTGAAPRWRGRTLETIQVWNRSFARNKLGPDRPRGNAPYYQGGDSEAGGGGGGGQTSTDWCYETTLLREGKRRMALRVEEGFASSDSENGKKEPEAKLVSKGEGQLLLYLRVLESSRIKKDGPQSLRLTLSIK